MIDRTADGRVFKILNIIDEYTRECLAMLVARKITDQYVIDLFFIFSSFVEFQHIFAPITARSLQRKQ